MISQNLSRWLLEPIVLDRIPHALLFVGSPQATAPLVQDFIKKIVQQEKEHHPDIHHFFPEGKTGMHSFSSIRNLLSEATLAPYIAQKKCFLIYEAERMLPTSSNALLKIVEEPPPKTLFCFMTSYEDKMLPTLLSRCQILYMPYSKDIEKSTLQSMFQSLLAGNEELDNFIKLLEGTKKEKEKKLFAEMPSDLTLLQKEAYEKEIEGTIALEYQMEMESLFVVLWEWYRDQSILELDLPSSLLSFPQREKRVPLPSWNLMQRSLREARLAVDRSIAPKVILESLLFRLGF